MLAPLKKKFHLGDDDGVQLRAPKRFPAVALPVVDEEFTPRLQDDDDLVQRLHAPSPLRTAAPTVVDEEFTPILTEDDSDQRARVGRATTAALSVVDEEFAFPLEEDEDHQQAANLRQPLTPSRIDVDDDFVVPAEEDEDHRQPVSLRLVPAFAPHPDDEDALTPILDDDDFQPPRIRPFRLVPAPRHDDAGEEFSPPPPPPPQPESGGDSWRYRLRRYLRQVRDEDIDQILTEYDLADADFEYGANDAVLVSATSLEVDVCATFLPVEVVERGNLVHFVATFEGDPDEVHFSYTRPQEERPVVDPGFDQLGSEIARVAEGVYAFSIDTTGFRGGSIQWHFWGVGQNQKSQFGEFMVRNRPPQLL